MGREKIKYRAFDFLINKMTYFDFDDLLNGDVEGLHPGSCDWELMRFTGLHDKNGKEIYEGDILRFPCEEPFSERHGSWTIYRVLWRNGCWQQSYMLSEKGQIVPKDYMGGLLLDNFEYSVKELIERDRDMRLEKGEIVGNIWENPDLLGDK